MRSMSFTIFIDGILYKHVHTHIILIVAKLSNAFFICDNYQWSFRKDLCKKRFLFKFKCLFPYLMSPNFCLTGKTIHELILKFIQHVFKSRKVFRLFSERFRNLFNLPCLYFEIYCCTKSVNEFDIIKVFLPPCRLLHHPWVF